MRTELPDSNVFRVLELSLAASPHRDRIPSLLIEADQLLGGEEVKRLSQN